MTLSEAKDYAEKHMSALYEAKPSKGFKHGWLHEGRPETAEHVLEFKSQTDIYEVRLWKTRAGFRLVILKSVECRLIKSGL